MATDVFLSEFQMEISSQMPQEIKTRGMLKKLRTLGVIKQERMNLITRATLMNINKESCPSNMSGVLQLAELIQMTKRSLERSFEQFRKSLRRRGL